jgi:endonuclease/exonuclease/phosphatase (EEP) superfamily protein YafD
MAGGGYLRTCSNRLARHGGYDRLYREDVHAGSAYHGGGRIAGRLRRLAWAYGSMKVRRIVRSVLGLAAAGATTLVLLGQAGRSSHLLDQINALLPPLLIGLALVLVVGLAMRDRWVAILSGIGLIVGTVQLGGAAFAQRGRPAQGGPPSLRIMTLSAFHANPKPEGIRKAVMAEKPDIVLLQEANGNAAQVIGTLLPTYYRLKSCRRPTCTLLIISRWPLRHILMRYDKKRATPDVLVAEVEAPFGRFRLINVHMPRPYDPGAERFAHLLALVARANAKLPVIVAGDFNAATGSFGLTRLAKEAHLQRADGFIPTYPANRPIPAFVGIDHMMADDRWAGADCRRTGAGNSDHFGLACRFQFAPAK